MQKPRCSAVTWLLKEHMAREWQSWDGKSSRSDSKTLIFSPASPSCPSHVPINSSVWVHLLYKTSLCNRPDTRRFNVVTMAFFPFNRGLYQIEVFLLLHISSQLPNDMFVQHGARRLFVLTAAPPAGPDGHPPGRGCGGAELHQPKAEGAAGGWPPVLTFWCLEDTAKIQKGCCDKRWVPACLSNLSSVFHTQPPACAGQWVSVKVITTDAD